MTALISLKANAFGMPPPSWSQLLLICKRFVLRKQTRITYNTPPTPCSCDNYVAHSQLPVNPLQPAHPPPLPLLCLCQLCNNSANMSHASGINFRINSWSHCSKSNRMTTPWFPNMSRHVRRRVQHLKTDHTTPGRHSGAAHIKSRQISQRNKDK